MCKNFKPNSSRKLVHTYNIVSSYYTHRVLQISRIFTTFANFGNSSHDKSKEWQKNSLLLSRIWVSISVVLTKRQKIDTWFWLRQNYLTNFGLQQEKNESAHSPTHNQNSKEKKIMRNECPTLLYLTKFF